MNFVKKQKILGTNSRHDSHENPENKEVNCLALFIRLISLQLKQLIIYKKNFANKELWSWFICNYWRLYFIKRRPKTKWPIDQNWRLLLVLVCYLKREMTAWPIFSLSTTTSKHQFWSICHLVFGHPKWNEASICDKINL